MTDPKLLVGIVHVCRNEQQLSGLPLITVLLFVRPQTIWHCFIDITFTPYPCSFMCMKSTISVHSQNSNSSPVAASPTLLSCRSSVLTITVTLNGTALSSTRAKVTGPASSSTLYSSLSYCTVTTKGNIRSRQDERQVEIACILYCRLHVEAITITCTVY